MQHANSSLTPNGRLRMVRLVEEELGHFEEPGHALSGDRSRRSRRVGWPTVVHPSWTS